jgi:hypothetical protein
MRITLNTKPINKRIESAAGFDIVYAGLMFIATTFDPIK